MEAWKKLTLLLCIYGVLKETRPLEPYITQFFIEPPMNFTRDQINLEIYPVSVYSNLVNLFIIFLVTDMVRYKPIIMLNSAAGIALYVMLLVCRSVFAIQVVEYLYGLYMACEVAYYTYIYTKVDKEHYQEATGYTRAAYLTGRALSGISSQILIYCGLSLMTLAKISLGIIVISTFWAYSLPPVTTSIYFNRNNDNSDSFSTNFLRRHYENTKTGFGYVYADFIAALKEKKIYSYVIWWAATNGGYLQVLQFVQVLWDEVSSSSSETKALMWTGTVEAICTFTGAFGAFLVGMWKLNWTIYGELGLCLGAWALGGVLIIMAYSQVMIVAFATYIAFSVIFNGVVTIAKSQIASNIKSDSTGLIFGITLFLALFLQTIVTIVLVQSWKFTARQQFAVWGYFYIVVGISVGLKWLFTLRKTMSTIPNEESQLSNNQINMFG